MTKTRLDIRLSGDIKAKAIKASAILGYDSLSAYVNAVIDMESSRVIEQHESIIVGNDIFERFMDACTKASTPNSNLVAAVRFAKDHVFQ